MPSVIFFLKEHRRLRDRPLFDLAVDRKLRSCDIIAARTIRNGAMVIQQKTGRPVQFELMTEARKTLLT